MTVQNFVDYISYQKRYSPHTLKAYHKDLEQFSDYLQSSYGYDDILLADHLIIRSWIIHLIESGVTTRSINRKLSALRSFFKYMKKQGETDKNPFNKVMNPKTGKSLPCFIKEDEILSLLEQEEPEEFKQLTELLIIEVFYSTGIRVSELVNIKIADIDGESNVLKVTGKRNKERLIPLNNILKDRINSYLSMKKRTQEGPDNNTYLFTTQKGKKMYPRLVYNIVNRNLSQISTQKNKSPHVLRHTFATHMLTHGADLNAIKELLGHANLSATQVYTHTTIGQLKSIHKRSHPREKIKEE